MVQKTDKQNAVAVIEKTTSKIPGVKQTHEIFRKFLEFLSSKSVLPLAIGLIMAETTKQIIGILVDGIIRPFIALFLPNSSEFAPLNFKIHGQVFKFGDLISALIQAFIVFAILYIIFAKLLKQKQLLEGKKK